jgi:hypothetical protein
MRIGMARDFVPGAMGGTDVLVESWPQSIRPGRFQRRIVGSSCAVSLKDIAASG